MNRLFWKVYLPVAACVVMTLILAVVAMARIIPAQINSYRENMEEFSQYLMSSTSLTRDQVLAKAEELDIEVVVEPAGGRPVGPHRPPEGFTRVHALPPDYPWHIEVSLSPGAGPGFFIRQSFWMIILLLLVTEGFVLFLALWPLRKRLSKLNCATSEFGSGNLGVRLQSSEGGDFIDSLGRTFNGMAGEIEALIASHRELLGIVAHELRTPLARMTLALELIKEDSAGGDLSKIDRMEKDLVALDQLVSELLAFNRISRRENLSSEDVDIVSVCRELSSAESWSREDLSIAVSGEGTYRGDRTLLSRALGNLIRNGVSHAAANLEVTVKPLENGGISVTVSDDGPGYPSSIRDRLGEPFVKGPESGGSGLGLAMTARIADLYGGELVFGSCGVLGGARAVLTLH